MLDKIFSFFSHDLGIDLGTTNTLVLVKGKGVIINEPSVVARQKKTKEVLAIGNRARKMLGKTPPMIEVVSPLQGGVIADFDATQSLLEYFIKQAHEGGGLIPKIPRPRVVIGIPSGVTEVERRAVQDACLSAGARKAFIIEEPMAAAIGLKITVTKPGGNLLIDIGGGTTEIATISLGGIIVERCLRVAGNKMDEAIINYMRMKHSILFGKTSAEEMKIQLGSATRDPKEKQEKQQVFRGRDLESGLPKSIKVTESEIREAIAPIVTQIMEAISDLVKETPPELTNDVVNRGIVLCGGGAKIKNLDKLIAEETKMPVWMADEPMTAVVKGCGRLLEDEKLLQQVKVTGGLR